MTEKFSKAERDYLRQLIIECDVQRFTEPEALSYIKRNTGKDVSREWYYTIKRRVKREAVERIKELRKSQHVFLSKFYDREHETDKRMQELWKLYNSNNNPYIKKSCMDSLREETRFRLELDLLIAAISNMPLYRDQGIVNLTDLHNESKKTAKKIMLDSKQVITNIDKDEQINEHTTNTINQKDNTGSNITF